MKRVLLLTCAVSLLFVFQGMAQKPSPEARPQAVPDHSTFPTYSSVETLLHHRTSAALHGAATIVGVAERIPLSPSAGASLRRSSGPASTPVLDVRRLERAPNGTVRWMEGRLGKLGISAAAGKNSVLAQAALSTLQPYTELLGLRDPARELQPMRTIVDELGYVHVRFEQTYEGLPVWGRDLYVHFDATGEAYAINGTYEPTPAAANTTPLLSEDVARSTVVSDLQGEGRWAPVPDDVAAWLGMEGPVSRLVLYPDPARGMRLAYEVSLHPNFVEWYVYLVDAQTGEVLNRIARHCTIHYDPDWRPTVRLAGVKAPVLSGKSSRSGTFVNASALDLNGQTQNLRVYQHDDGVFYKLWDLDNLTIAQSTLPDNPDGGALTISANNTDFGENVQLTHVVSDNNTWNDPTSVSAHFNMKVAYDYYKETHGRKAIDDKDQSLISVIHVTDGGQPMDNAFWNGRVMAYGDGQQLFKPFAGGLDVAGHEMSHGVIQHTADLIYQFQSGALNESFADVFGAMIDRDDLLMGEDIMQQHLALRDLLNPGNSQVLSRQPAHMSEFENLSAEQDNGGVHVNSGIPNRAAALIIETISREKTEQIYHRALTTYLTRNSQFGDARTAIEQSAADLHGAGSVEVKAVQDAFDAVGISSTSGSDADEGNDLPPQTGGQSLITFLLQDGRIGILDLTDSSNPTAFVFSHPDAVARVDLETEDFTQLTTPRNGERIYFINQNFQLAFVEVATGEVGIFEDLFLFQEGDLWNASIAPDESVAALVSGYDDDPTLYFTDGQEVIGAIDLKPETTQEGIQDESIRLPDVVSWSPNPQILRIAFDALNEVAFGGLGGAISYWSIYEIDFSSERIYNLLPAQPSEISVGNITYSNTDPDLFAFNVFDESGTWDVLVGNFESGEILALEIPTFTLNGTPITDAQRPTFSPDDTQLAFSSPSLGVMLFYDGNASENPLSFLDLQTPVFNPRWFISGGSGGSQNQAPVASFTASVTSGTAPLSVGFDAGASGDPNGDAITYHWDFGDGSFGSGVQASHTYARPGTFTVLLTVTDGGGLSGQASVEINVSQTGVAVEEDASELPRSVALHQNHPNPFNPATTLRFDLPGAMDVELEVLDMLGRTVATVVQGSLEAGTHERFFDAGELPSGIYLVRLRAGTVVQTRKIVLLR